MGVQEMREKLEAKIDAADRSAEIYLHRWANDDTDPELREYLLDEAAKMLVRREHLKKMLATLTEIENAAL
jgi:hypothetical protein